MLFRSAFNLKKHKIDRLFFYKDNHLFIALDTALKNEGFKVIRKDNAITISKGIKSVTFSLTSRQVSVSIDKKFTTQQLVHPVIKKSKRYYYPLTSFVSAFDYDIDWDAKDRIISLLSKVQQFKVIKSGKYPKLSIQLSNPVDSLQLHTLPIPNTYKVDIPFSKSRLDKSFYFLHSNPVVQLSALDSHKTTQIQFLMKTKTLHPSIAKTKTGFDIQFYPVIKTLKESSDPYNLDLKITGSQKFNYKIWSPKKKPQLIIDIPDSISNLPQIIRTDSELYQRIRTSQLTKTPPKTRVVIDLYKKPKSYKKSFKGNTLSLRIPIVKETKISKPSAKGPLTNKVIVLDAGHGGNDPGAVKRNIYEKNFTLDIAKRLKRHLQKDGAFVVMVRNGNSNPSLRRRARIANRNKADIYVSIHINSFIKSSANGTETYYFKYKDKQLARSLQKEMNRTLKLKNNGVKRARLYVLRHTKMPAALVEPLFMTNPRELKKVRSPEFREKIALSLHKGIVNYFKTPKKKSKKRSKRSRRR